MERARFRQSVFFSILLLVSVATPASAHLFNHHDRHEVCDIYAAPTVHSIHDGHTHWHHTAPVAEGHMHGAEHAGPGHTHADTFHDPCDQAGMFHYTFSDAPPFDAPDLPSLVIGVREPGTVNMLLPRAIAGVRLPVPAITMQDALIVVGDDGLRRFPGSGTPEDPYVIEGYHLRDLLMIKDTTKCIVVRNNIVYNDAIRGPLVDPSEIVDLSALVDDLRALLAARQADLDAALLAQTEQAAAMVDLRAARDAWKTNASAMNAQWSALTDAVKADVAARDAARLAAQATMGDIRQTTRELRAAVAQRGVELPAEPPATLEPDDPLLGAFATAVQAATAEVAHDDTRVADLSARLALLRDGYATQRATLAAAKLALENSRDARDAFRPTLDGFRAQQRAWLDDVFAPAQVRTAQTHAQVRALRAEIESTRVSLDLAVARLADHALEIQGLPFDTLDEIARWALSLVELPTQELNGRLILDWNGQCVHAYHNVIQDLRVNRNNARAGYATGGLLEDNRIFTVGQIRHFDGEFRENEVGDRRYIEAYLNGTLMSHTLDTTEDFTGNGGAEIVPIRTGRAINADGFNEAWMHDNVIYGAVDLDFHGHHHGAGFFARESHYHGTQHAHAYMVNATTGGCAYTQPTPPATLAPLGVDARVPVLDNSETACLPHHDHTKRWTSVRFERNTILDPLGSGLRYEDQDHAGDDRVAASESMTELNVPHFHRSHIALADNVVMGSLWIDVFNADGIELWDDDHTPVRRDIRGLILDVAEHLGARIVNSHPQRNAGWIDLTENAIFLVEKPAAVRAGLDGWSAMQLSDVKQADKIDIAGNRAFLVAQGFDAGTTDVDAFVEKLRALAIADPHEAYAEIGAWGGTHPSHPASRAVHMRGVADSFVRVCGNTFLGFDMGLHATVNIRPDVGFHDCGDNDWGSASKPFRVVTTPYPEEREPLLQQAAELSDGTLAERHAHSAADHAGLLVPT